MIMKLIINLKTKIQHALMLRKSDISQRFDIIYSKNLWSSSETGSGRGSEIENTKELRRRLPELIKNRNIKTLVDAPCGDCNWITDVLRNENLEYVGVDIVDRVIAENKEKFKNLGIKNASFKTADIRFDSLPKSELILMRDCLFHLSFSDINNVLKNLDRTNYSFLLVTTHIGRHSIVNKDIISGDFRHLDIFKPPLNFCQQHILDTISEYSASEKIEKKMVLFSKTDVPKRLLINGMDT